MALLRTLMVVLAACGYAGLSAPAHAQAGVPTPAQVRADYRASDVRLLDRHGDPIDSIRINMAVKRAPWVALADVSPALGAALMQAEDQHFMEHGGVDLQALGKAAWDNLFRSRPRGASTITMQLAALLDARRRAAAWARNGTRRAPRRRSSRAGASRRSSKPT
jgi:penicillin-binding protein 1C